MKLREVQFQRIVLQLVSSAALVFVVFGVYLFFYSDESFRMIISLVCAFSLFLPRILFYRTTWSKYMTLQEIAVIEVLLLFILSLNGIGALGFYLQLTYYDMVLHVLGPIAGGVILYLIIGSCLLYRERYEPLKAQLIVIIIAMSCIFLWEGWEYFGDSVFHTQMVGQLGEPLDTTFDIIAGICSMMLLYVVNIVLHKHFFSKKIKNLK